MLRSLLLLSLFAVPAAFAQGVTTAALHGVVTDTNGEPLPGANVVAVHVPTGTTYGAATRIDGRYNLTGLRVGGPYSVTASFIGFAEAVEEGIQLAIGQDLGIDFRLAESNAQLEDVIVTATTDPVLNSDRTGAATYVERAEIEALPTISRSTQDFTRLTPQASGLSFGGRNTLYNNFSLDGSIFNNPYGLDSPVPGGQTNAQPVSLEAVDQVQVTLAPFDVRQGGFTGAGVNTVTKSGTNEYQVVLYSYGRNEGLIGDQVAGEEVVNPDLSFNQSGISLSGPIVENTLFFYANAELERRDDPGTNFVASRGGQTGEGISRVDADVLDLISERLRTQYGYETGPYQDYINATNNDKLLAKLDWNVSRDHTASLRFNYLNAERQLPPHPFAISINNSGRGPNANTLPFRNAGYQINNDIYSLVGEVNSRFSNSLASNLIVGYTAFRDNRDPFSDPFPTIEIAEDGVTYTTVGHEPFSINNVLDQDVFQLTNNLTYYRGRHTLTAGVNYEQFEFLNSFNLFYYGLFAAPSFVDLNGDGTPAGNGTSFLSLQDFLDATDPNNPAYRDFRAETEAILDQRRPFAAAETNVAQAAIYAQDEYQVTPTLRATLGLRVDVPLYFTDLDGNEAARALTFRDEEGNPETLDVSQYPSSTPLFSPRIGINWAVDEARTLQVRGGTGVFSGRLPFVWLGNLASNQGIDDPAGTGTINALADDFQWTQVWKTNLAADYDLGGTVLTFEGIYGKDLNAIYVRNANLAGSIGTSQLDGRPLFPGVRGDSPVLNATSTGAYVLDNSDEGYQYSLTAQLRRAFGIGQGGGVNTTLAYTFSEAKDVMTSTEIAEFVFAGNAVSGNPNTPELAHSQFGLRHRVIGSAAARFVYGSGNRFGTTVGAVVEAGRGNRFSYTYAGDFNGDGVAGNDLIFVPQDVRDIVLVNGQYDAFERFIEQDDYLSDIRGEISERNGALSPWFAQLDLRLAQDVAVQAFGRTNRLQISLDIENALNLLNSDWGVRELVNTNQPLVYRGLDGDTPTFEYVGGDNETFRNDASLLSRWRAQLGVRYVFGG
jgi:hypothetical protein